MNTLKITTCNSQNKTSKTQKVAANSKTLLWEVSAFCGIPLDQLMDLLKDEKSGWIKEGEMIVRTQDGISSFFSLSK